MLFWVRVRCCSINIFSRLGRLCVRVMVIIVMVSVVRKLCRLIGMLVVVLLVLVVYWYRVMLLR